MPRPRTTPEAYDLLHQGMLALAEVTHNGMRVDMGYITSTLADTDVRAKALVAQIAADPIAKDWRRRFREKTNFMSADQLSAVVFGDGKGDKGLGFVPKRMTDKKDRAGADEKSFVHVKEELPVIKTLFEAKKIVKSTEFLVGIRREAVEHADGCHYVHPNFGLNTTITHRSSSDSPNVQNQPKRNPVQAKIVRRAFIPRPGCHILQMDEAQVEARSPCFYTFDPVLMKYVSDPKSDMHRDMAAQIFKLPPDKVSKGLRQLTKGQYVFATFYGSYWGLTAKALWEDIDNPADPAKTTDGVLVRDHLTRLGFTELGDLNGDPRPGTWAHHVREIDRDFWGTRFKVYAQWKRDYFEAYLRDGGFLTLTGFAICLPLDKKQVCNSPCQSTAFHIVLRAIIKVNQWLKRHKFRTRVICEIHDAILLDGPPSERDDVIDIVIHYMTTDAMKAWPWINVPLLSDAEICPLNQSWYDCVGMKLDPASNVWLPAKADAWAEKFGDWSLQNPA